MKKEEFSLLAINDPAFNTKPGQIVYVEINNIFGKDKTIHYAFNQNSLIAILIGPNGDYKTTTLKILANHKDVAKETYNLNKVVFVNKNVGYVLFSKTGGTMLGKNKLTYEEIAKAIKDQDQNPDYNKGIDVDENYLYRDDDPWYYNGCYLRKTEAEISEINSTYYEITGEENIMDRFGAVHHLSKGENKLLSIIELLVCYHEDIILWDEIENSLHICWQEKLSSGGILQRLVEKNNNQLIYVTHSPSMVVGNIPAIIETLE